ncbi:MAG: wax ester/triacylglycerol synthase domain-containing protein, partial [Acidimicrobiales bacterium]
YHLRHSALPDPGSNEQLRILMGRLMSQQLDRTKPLWELWIVENLTGGRWALVSKVHQAVVDGIEGSDILTLMLTREPYTAGLEAEPWNPRPEPSDLDLVLDAGRDLATSPMEQYRAVTGVFDRPRQAMEQMSQSLYQLSALAPPERAAGSLTGPLGPHRRWHDVRVPLSSVKRIRSALHGSVNDVVLAAIAHGFRMLLLHRGETVERRYVRTFVPVSVHSTDDQDEYDNSVSATFTDLPVGVDHPLDALELITRQLERLKDTDQAVAGEILTSLSGFSPPLLLALGTRAATSAVGELEGIHTICANLPGPQTTLYLLDRPMVEAYPYLPLRTELRLAVAAFSYNHQLFFGLTGDYDTSEDLEVLANGIEEGIAELLEAAEDAERADATSAAS